MEHELRAEYVDGSSAADLNAQVKVWHVVRQGGVTAMCGRDLEPSAAVRPVDDWDTPGMSICHSCGALYLRESP
jgi:hypothetical protein